MPTAAIRTNAKTVSSELISFFRERILDGRLPVGATLPREVELAKEHGVSRATVRQAFNILVTEGLIERQKGRGTFVLSINPDQLGKSEVPTPVEKRIGTLLAFEPGDQLNLSIMMGIEESAKARGYQVNFVFFRENEEQQSIDLQRMKDDRVSGMIIFPVSKKSYDQSIWRLKSQNFPFVLVDRYFLDLDSDYVTSDNRGGGYRATEHLIILGHRRIGFASTDATRTLATAVNERYLGYRQALETYGLPYDERLVLQNDATWERFMLPDQANLYDDFLSRPNPPSAIFAVNDYVALAFMQAAKRLNLRVPEDLAIVGFDDASFAAHLSCPLTTVAQSGVEMGVRACNILINRIEGDHAPSYQVKLPNKLVVRSSCGAKLKVLNSLSGSQITS